MQAGAYKLSTENTDTKNAETLVKIKASAPNKKSARRDSNPRPQPWQGCTPPTEPLAHNQIGVTGFEPATSWSQTRRSSQAEPHPVSNYSTYPQNHTLKIYSSVFTTYNHGVTHRLSAYFVTLASPMSEARQVPASRCKHLPSVPFHSSAAP